VGIAAVRGDLSFGRHVRLRAFALR
jgi:hypothetical protein